MKRTAAACLAGVLLALQMPAVGLADTAAPAAAVPAAAAPEAAPAAATPPYAGLGTVDEVTRNTRETGVYTALVTGSSAITCLLPHRPEVTSMAGGVELLSTRSVGFAGSIGNLKETDTLPVEVPLAEVLNGRSLRIGEAIYGMYDTGSWYYLIGTVIEGQVVRVNIPCINMNQGTTLTFFVGRGAYAGTPGVDYLAIGNSITIHPRREFWPNAMGMGASALDKDYFHLVQKGLSNKFGSVTGVACNFAIWESMNGNREYDLTLLYPYLSTQPEIISVQLGENFQDDANFGAAYEHLIAYIRTLCPSSQLVLVGSFWKNDGQEAIKRQIAEKYSAAYVDITAIQNQAKYVFGINSAYDANGVAHRLSNPGTAVHPNDAAMAYIANGILGVFGK